MVFAAISVPVTVRLRSASTSPGSISLVMTMVRFKSARMAGDSMSKVIDPLAMDALRSSSTPGASMSRVTMPGVI